MMEPRGEGSDGEKARGGISFLLSIIKMFWRTFWESLLYNLGNSFSWSHITTAQ